MTNKKPEEKPDKDKKQEPIPFNEAVSRLLRAPTTTNEDISKKSKDKNK